MRAFDILGRGVRRVVINTICPIKYAAEARAIAFAYMRDIEGRGRTSDTIDQMLPTKLGAVGSDEVTHVWCSRDGFTHQVETEVATLSGTGLSWCSTKAYKITNDLSPVKSLFCCIVGDSGVVLEMLGLEVKE